MRAIADVQTASNLDASVAQSFDFADEGGGIDDHSSADDGVTAGAQNAARDQLKDVAIFADDDGVSGVVSSGYASDVVERAGEIVDDFAFSFIAPLRTYHDDRIHSDLSYAADRWQLII